MHVIRQTLVVREWPLKKPGDEVFFGYVVGVGVYTGDWSDDSMFAYADFAYNDSYVRYRLPRDKELVKDLVGYLSENVEMQGAGLGGIYGKVWVKLGNGGHLVGTP